LAECTYDSCVKRYKAKQDRKLGSTEKTDVKGQQHLNAELKQNVKNDHIHDTADEEYCGYDTGNEFHQQGSNLTTNQAKVGDALILLDSQSTHSTFYVRRLVCNIRKAPRPLKMSTNGGTITYTQQADLPNYDVVWFNEESIANIISMSEAEHRGHIISYLPGCLTLTNTENGFMMDFRMTQAGLYAFEVPIDGTGLFQTITENKQFFTSRQMSCMPKQSLEKNLEVCKAKP
jgi:hypothetical protein